jgi:hypothetical protein
MGGAAGNYRNDIVIFRADDFILIFYYKYQYDMIMWLLISMIYSALRLANFPLLM